MDGDYDSALDAGVYGNGIGSAADNVTGAWLQRACEEWIAAKHVLFHVANVCFSVAFVSPNIFRYHVLFMRALVCSGFFLLLLWTSIYACHADMLTWNCLFLLISLVHLGSLLWELHPAKFSRDLDEIYRRHFKPLRVSSGLFKELAKIGEMRTLSVQDDYAKEDVTVAGERLSVLISGSLKVTRKTHHLHFVSQSQFIDSLEWERCQPADDETFQVSVTATNDCRLISFPRDRLCQLLASKPFLADVIKMALGRDITQKMYSLNNYIRFMSGHRKDVILRGMPLPRSVSLDGWGSGSSRSSPAKHSVRSGSPAHSSYGSGAGFSRDSPRHRPSVAADHKCGRSVTTAYGQVIYMPDEALRETAADAFTKPMKTSTETCV